MTQPSLEHFLDLTITLSLSVEKFLKGTAQRSSVLLPYLHGNDDGGGQLSGWRDERRVLSDNGGVDGTAHEIFFMDGAQLLVEGGDAYVSTGQDRNLTGPRHKAP